MPKLILYILVLIFHTATFLSSAAADNLLRWQLENPFRFFQNPAHTQLHRAVFKALSDEHKQSPVSMSERLLANTNPRGWAEDVFEHTCWSRQKNTYFNCQGRIRDYINPSSHIVHVRIGEDAQFAALGSEACRWRVKNAAKQTIKILRQKCTDLARISIPYPKGAYVSLEHKGQVIDEINIKVRDILVVGMGDSFASGEGNPDKAVRFSPSRYVEYGKQKAGAPALTKLPTRIGSWLKVADDRFMKHRAKWLGQSCHRSLYSHQLRTALQLAIENPQRSVTFISSACAGAEVTKGLFLLEPGNEWSPSPPKQSQISLIANSTCGRGVAPRTGFPRAYSLEGELPILEDIYIRKCPRRKARKIDLLLLSIGGNDVGFSRLVANVVVDDNSKLKKLGGWMGQVFSPEDASVRLKDLTLHYKVLKRALHNILHIPWHQADRVILTAYPNMSFLHNGTKICDTGRQGMSITPVFNLSRDRAIKAEQFAENLNIFMRQAATKNKWSFVESHRQNFKSHGICAKDPNRREVEAEELRVPVWKEGEWVPYNPADYAPYAQRTRWFRTPNDAYMTAHLHVSGPVLSKILKIKSLNIFQLLIAGTYSGAFHPTAEGQAVIADAAVMKARQVLNKYGQN